MAEIRYSASGPPAKGLEYRDTYLLCGCIVAFAALLLFNPGVTRLLTFLDHLLVPAA
jgi:hypothetical protein